ncbi:bud site selection protein 3 [[Candida] anglica]|uniref:Bud site selection protein 3 n=1 Tax=[Candida] anglica TaxID=148631 RepID=A0ABP0EHM9_9ASCO
MDVYKRYASREHNVPLLGTAGPRQEPEKVDSSKQDHLQQAGSKNELSNPPGGALDGTTTSSGIELALVLGQQGTINNHNIDNNNMTSANKSRLSLSTHSPTAGTFPHNSSPSSSHTSIQQWLDVFPHAVYFEGTDELFGKIVIMVYSHPHSHKTSTTSFTKFGTITYENLILDARSRFWPSCENLLPMYQKSNVRRALAITNLKNYNRLANATYGHKHMNSHWDETTAGNFANNMVLISRFKPLDLGLQLMEMGLLQAHLVNSIVLDVVYDNGEDVSAQTIEENNQIVFLLGQQLDQLFDPLLEYSPEVMDINYRAPTTNTTYPLVNDSPLIASIIDELITVQTNYTMSLVSLLQDLIIPLRISILSASANDGIMKINQVFPPTIDEVTRINCILLDSLVKASKHGPHEVFKVMGMVLPYFYKPFIRHEANVKQFTQKLNRFHAKNIDNVFENPQINQGNYTTREIDTIVRGSLLELSKIKMILKRLYEEVNNSEDVDTYYQAAIGVCDAFGYEDEASKPQTSQRIFTPTGKILTEVASNWPAELQYGWLSRKVVGIYELRNVKNHAEDFAIDVLIIFSDHLLFLTVTDKEYNAGSTTVKNLSVADILIHAMVNEKPLPQSLPSMEVSSWCDINEVVVSSYKSVTEKEVEGDYLRFFVTDKEGFKQRGTASRVFSTSYQVLQSDTLKPTVQIIELINKAKILNKNQPFHLFKTVGKDLTMYSTAHDCAVYKAEQCKSPFVLFLNLPTEKTRDFFKSHPEIFVMFNISFINEHRLHLEGYNRTGGLQISEIVSSADLQEYIVDLIAKCFLSYVNFYNDSVRGNLIESYRSDIEFYLEGFVHREVRVGIPPPIPSVTDGLARKPTHQSLVQSIPEVYMEKYIMGRAPKNVEEEIRGRSSPAVDAPETYTTRKRKAQTAPVESPKKKRKSFFRRILGIFKKDKEVKPRSAKPNSTTRDRGRVSSTIRRPQIHQQPEPQVIPEVEHLYQPQPAIRKRISSYNLQHNPPTQGNDAREEKFTAQQAPIIFDTPNPNQDNFNQLDAPPHVPHSAIEENTIPDVTAHPVGPVGQQYIPVGQQNASAPPMHRSMTEENVISLDRIQSHSYRNKLNRFLDSDVPTVAGELDLTRAFSKELYRDGQANWVTITRENSSLLDAEIRALKEDANMDTLDVIDVRGGSEEEDSTANNTPATDETNSTFETSVKVVTIPSRVFSVKRDISTRSLDSVEVMEQFERDIDKKFSALDIVSEDVTAEDSNEFYFGGRNSSTSSPEARETFLSGRPATSLMNERIFHVPKETDPGFTTKANEETTDTKAPTGTKDEPYQVADMDSLEEVDDHDETPYRSPLMYQKDKFVCASSSEEFYSPDEEAQVVDHKACTSISSDATVTNEKGAINPKETVPPLPICKELSHNGQPSQDIAHQPESVSYLSDLLEGTLRFDYEFESSNNSIVREASEVPDIPEASEEPSPPPTTIIRYQLPVHESPSLIYLGKIIHSGKTVRKEMNKIVQ